MTGEEDVFSSSQRIESLFRVTQNLSPWSESFKVWVVNFKLSTLYERKLTAFCLAELTFNLQLDSGVQ